MFGIKTKEQFEIKSSFKLRMLQVSDIYIYSMVNVPVPVYHILCYLLIKFHVFIVSTISFMTRLGVTIYLLSLKTQKYAVIFLTSHSCYSL